MCYIHFVRMEPMWMLPGPLTASEWQLYRELWACAWLLCLDAGQLCWWGLPVSCSPWVLISHCLWGPVGILGDLIRAPFFPPLGSQTGALVVYLHQLLVGAHKDISSPCFAGGVPRFWTLPSSWFSLLFMGELKDVQYLFYPLDISLQWLQILSKSFNCREVFTNIQYFLWSYNTSNCE